jgi:hypothetical protein
MVSPVRVRVTPLLFSSILQVKRHSIEKGLSVRKALTTMIFLLGDLANDFDGIPHMEAFKECCPDQWGQTFLRGGG